MRLRNDEVRAVRVSNYAITCFNWIYAGVERSLFSANMCQRNYITACVLYHGCIRTRARVI